MITTKTNYDNMRYITTSNHDNKSKIYYHDNKTNHDNKSKIYYH